MATDGTVTYVTIKGKVGSTHVDLQVGVPVDTIMDQVPAMLYSIMKPRPKLDVAMNKFKDWVVAQLT